ncbi:MAG: PQQ-dependent sugar dehydrogenase [Candidatus Margulisiibacteriota bacterium]|nr:PQQ-dependent sugar dehydrogenase [Candidatus Margulisiibacteriota bacterium]
MQRYIYLLLILSISIFPHNFQLNTVISGLRSPWGFCFKSQKHILITEKQGKINQLDLTNNSLQNIDHNLNILVHGQGGLLDIVYHNDYVYVTFSENRGKNTSSTSIARAKYSPLKMNFKTIFRAEPAIESGYHFGSRIAIKDDHIYASIGERGQGMIAQDGRSHPGSIIRIRLDGTIPTDNPIFTTKPNWQPEIYQIGIRNPQGMAYSPLDQHIYMTNHGAKGGDWFGRAEKGGNYGWKILGWGGTNYSGLPIGPKWKDGFTKPIHYWTPSIAVSSLVIYRGEAFSNWTGHALIGSLKDRSLRKLVFNQTTTLNESILFKGTIGRIRDIKIQPETGYIFLLDGSGRLWQMTPKNEY